MARNEALSAALEHARAARGMSVRKLQDETGLSTATIMRYLKAPEAVRPEVLNRITAALGLPNARLDEGGVWRIPATAGSGGPPDPTESTSTVVTDGGVVLTLRVPPGFLEELTVDERAGIEADALLAVMKMARDVRKDRAGNNGT